MATKVLTIDHLFDLIDPLGVGFRFNPISDATKTLELQVIDRTSKSVTISGKRCGEAELSRAVSLLKEKVPIAVTDLNKEGGSNRAYLANLLSYTSEFYFSKLRRTFIVWLPSDTHTSGTQGLLSKVQLDAKCAKNDTALENLILYGPPGTGKTFDTRRLAVEAIDGRYDESTGPSIYKRYIDAGRIVFVTFHQSYSYEDFVEGIHVDISSGTPVYSPKPGVFKRICEAATTSYNANPSNPDRYVIIIDEINRGNISKVFGELITLIEPSKRIKAIDERFVTLPYSPGLFGVPQNLFIIGTMNSADKSISVIDSALRRRFRFIDYEPKPSDLKPIGTGRSKVELSKMLEMINRRITALLDKDHVIGHTYFRDVTTLSELAVVFRDKIIPLLQETFFNNDTEIRLVLNGGDAFTKNPANHFFVAEPKYKHKELFGKNLEEHDEKTVYVLNPLLSDDKLDKIKPAFFKAIYEKSK